MLLIFAVLLLSACGGGGNSGGGSSGGNSGTAPPGAPTGLTVTAGNAQVALSWTALSGASRYTVYYSQASIASLKTGAGGPRWDVKVTDNTSRNALYTFQGSLRSSGTGASTRNLHAPSGWVPSDSAGRYGEPRVAAPFAILSFTWDAVQKFVAVDPDVNVPALEYRWSIRNRSATARDLADGAIRSSFYQGGPRPC